MTAEWCKDVVEEAIRLNGKPEIFNTDQGSQFTSEVFTGLLKSNEIQISMDGKGRALDNILIEVRLVCFGTVRENAGRSRAATAA